VTRPRILLTGAAGQLGFELARALAPHGELHAVDRSAVDVGDPAALSAAVRRTQPQLIVNAAAYTAVDRAETEIEAANAVNAIAPAVLADEAKRAGALLVHYSTDYVFDGASAMPYTEGAATGPLNVYGQSKLAGERAVLASGAAAVVLRTSWVYGLRGSNFLLTMRRLAVTREELRVVADQFGVPNWTRVLADATASIVGQGLSSLAERAGLYHLSCKGCTTWYEFASAIIGPAARPRVVPITTAEYPTPARRPRYAVLDASKFENAFGLTLPDWRPGLEACLQGAN
jgi:dTDP-4-dehydrorhamnose reductase